MNIQRCKVVEITCKDPNEKEFVRFKEVLKRRDLNSMEIS